MIVPEAITISLIVEHCDRTVFDTLTYEDLRIGKDCFHTMADFDEFLKDYEQEVLTRSPHAIFSRLINVMGIDNGCTFLFTVDQMTKAIKPIQVLVNAGFFADDPSDLQGSYWMAAAGESTEAPAYFGKEAAAFEALNAILDDVFDNPLAETTEHEATGGKRLADLKRLHFLDETVTGAYVSSCFELDGGVHLTIEAPSSEPKVYRNCNTLREAIDQAMADAKERQP